MLGGKHTLNKCYAPNSEVHLITRVYGICIVTSPIAYNMHVITLIYHLPIQTIQQYLHCSEHVDIFQKIQDIAENRWSRRGRVLQPQRNSLIWG